MTLLVSRALTHVHALSFFAILLGITAGVYLGFAVLDGRPREIVLEVIALLIFFALAYFGLWRSPMYLVAGFIAHGLWDTLHHPRAVQTKKVDWYPPACLVYDVLVGAYIFFWLRA